MIELVTTPATPTPPPAERIPWVRFAFDRTRANRLYAAGSVSDDQGRTWRPLESDGVRVDALSGALAPPPLPGPNGRLLVAGVQIERPGVAGSLAAEWRDGGWVPFGLRTNLPVRALGYTTDGTAFVATEREVLTSDGRSWATPGRLVVALVSQAGAIYAAIDEEGRFGLYRAEAFGAPWLPVAGAGKVDLLADVAGTILVTRGRRVGLLDQGQWSWSDLPTNEQPLGLTVHPMRPLVAVWSESRLLTSADGGRQFRSSPLGYKVGWAAWDPFAADTLTLVEPSGGAYRVSIQDMP
jgi:hypothetical protein